MDDFERIKILLKSIHDEDIIFKRHFYSRTLERPIDESLVRENIKKTDDILKIEQQPARKDGEEKFKIWIRLSRRYALVLVVAVAQKKLIIITGWNAKWQK
ncbi:MAG: hypothetical protein V1659_02325 [Candidatus Woesearchaeota archaeon]